VQNTAGTWSEPHELGRQPERVLALHRLDQRLGGGPEEEHEGDQELWCQQQVGQAALLERDALFHP
jgi:hypothetical protein